MVDLRWSHWLGLAIWALAVFLAHRQTTQYAPDADPYLLPAAALLAGWGLLTIWRLDSGFGCGRHSGWLSVPASFGIGVRFPQILDILRRYKYIFLVSGLLLTALTLIFGTTRVAVVRVYGWGAAVYTCSHRALKLLLVVYLAAFLANRIPIQTRLLAALAAIPVFDRLALAILLTQRDLGTASIFIFLYAAMSIWPAETPAPVDLIRIAAGCRLVGYSFVDIIRYRLTAWIDPWTDPSGRSFQVIQSILAVANGGLIRPRPRHGLTRPGARRAFGFHIHQHRRRNRAAWQFCLINAAGVDHDAWLFDRNPRLQ